MDGPTLELLPMPPAAADRGRAGEGALGLSQVNGRTRVTRCVARQPLKIVAPASPTGAALAYVTTYGGGLLAGDAIRLAVDAAAGTTTFLTTQSATKVFRSADGRTASQALSADVGDDALLVAWPDPVVCFAGARYEQRQTFRLAAGGSLALVDCQTAGRMARGERWAFRRYASRNTIDVDGRVVIDDAVVLDEEDGLIGAAFRTGRFDGLATVILIGPRVRPLIDALAAAEVERRSHAVRGAAAAAAVLSAVSRHGDALVIRAAVAAAGAGGPQALAASLRRTLAPLYELLGLDPWSRKW